MRRAAFVFVLVALILAAAVCLSACDEKGRSEASVSYDGKVYIAGAERADGEVVVVLSSAESEEGAVACRITQSTRRKDAFNDISAVRYSVSAEDALAAAAEYLAGSGEDSGGGLIIRLDYVTMNGKINSDGEVVRSGDAYVHSAFLRAGADTLELEVTLVSPYTAAWYALAAGLTAGALLVAAAVAAVIGAYKKRKRENDGR